MTEVKATLADEAMQVAGRMAKVWRLSEDETHPMEIIMDDITRIEFEPLGDGRFRWRLWAGDRLTHDEMSRADTVDAMLETTKILCMTQIPSPGEQHAEASRDESA